MAVQLRERPTSRSAQASPYHKTLNYSLSGVGDDIYAQWYVTVGTPLMYDGLYRQDIKLTAQGAGLWNVEVSYAPRKKNELGEYTLTFDTTGGMAHITQAKGHISDHKAPGDPNDAKNHQGAINVTENGAEGTDIVVPQFKWTEAWELPVAYASFTYAAILKAVTGRVNLNPFRNFPAGQVRFDGAQGRASNKNPDLCSLTFHFTQSDDTADAVPEFKVGIVKLGWQYLWVEHHRDEQAGAKDLISPPLAVHVERVYDATAFGVLGLGS